MGVLSDIQVNLGFQPPQMRPDVDDLIQLESMQLNKSETWGVVADALRGLDHAPKEGDFKSFVKVYASVVWVYVAAWVISSSIANAPLLLKRKVKGKPDELIMEGALYELLQEPNPYESIAELLEDLVLFLELTGCGYWEKYGSVEKLPVKLYNMEPQYVSIVPHPTEKIAYFEYDLQTGQKKKFYPQQICQFKYANPNSIFYGQGAVRALTASVITELYRESYNKSFFENEARPDVVLKHNADITKGIIPLIPEIKKRFAAEWYHAFGGPRKQRLPVVLESGMDISVLSEARRDMDFREMEKSLRERIFAAFGVPPAMAGIYEYANYANAKEQIRIFWTTTLPPKCKRIQNAIYRNIIRPYDPDLYVEFDMRFVPALEETIKEREERLSRMIERGGMTIGEYARELGHPMDVEDEKKFGKKRMIAANLVPLDDAFMQLPEEGIPGGEQPAKPKFPEETSPAFQPGVGARE